MTFCMFNILSNDGKGTGDCAMCCFYTSRFFCTGVAGVLSSSNNLPVLLLTCPNFSGDPFTATGGINKKG